MEKELNYKKVIIAAIIGLIVIAGLFTGIAKLVNLKRPFSTEKFYDLLNNDSYNRAYSNLSEATQLKYNKNDFEKYYKDTMQAIGGTKIRVENVNRYNKGASQYVDCEIIYETKNFGELKEQHTLQLDLNLNGHLQTYLMIWKKGTALRFQLTMASEEKFLRRMTLFW